MSPSGSDVPGAFAASSATLISSEASASPPSAPATPVASAVPPAAPPMSREDHARVDMINNAWSVYTLSKEIRLDGIQKIGGSENYHAWRDLMRLLLRNLYLGGCLSSDIMNIRASDPPQNVGKLTLLQARCTRIYSKALTLPVNYEALRREKKPKHTFGHNPATWYPFEANPVPKEPP